MLPKVSSLSSNPGSLVIGLGVGVIFGFFIFDSLVHHRYVIRLHQTEQVHNRTLEVIRDKFIEADKERKQCIDIDNGRLEEMSEIKGRMEASLESFRYLYGASKDLEAELDRKDTDLAAIKEEIETNYQIKIELESRIEEKDDELVNVKEQYNMLDQRRSQVEHEIEGMRHSLTSMQTEIEKKDAELSLFRKEESTLETKLANLREGMLDLLRQKINEIQSLENQVDVLSEEKNILEEKLNNWQNGMLKLVKEKINEIDALKSELSESRETIKEMSDEIDSLQMERAESEEFMKEQVDTIDEPESDVTDEIEELKAELEESQNWIYNKRQEIEILQLEQIDSQKLISEKMNEIESLRSELAKEQELTTERTSKLESDLTKTRVLVEIKSNEIENLNTQWEEFVKEINGLQSNLFNSEVRSTSEIMINHVQQRDNVMCRQLFGRGPYYIKFVINLKIEETENFFFVIEISSRKELPHSVYTFLTLVESNLYNDGAAFLSSSRDGYLQIGSNSNGAIGDGITLERKLNPMGMSDGTALSFEESSTSKNTNCVRFIDRGPRLNIFLPPVKDADCFGQVIRGQERLDDIRLLLLQNGKQVEILSVTHLRVD